MRSFCGMLVPLISLVGAITVQAADRPNVLFIAIDDLNDWVGCLNGHPQAQTPNIDALAASGINFTNAHCQAPICNCSRVSMLLGKYASTTGMYFLAPGFRQADKTKDEVTLPQYFRLNGYRTSTCGKIFHGKADRRSFDHVEPVTGWRRYNEKIRYKVARAHPLWDWGQVDVADEEQRDYHTATWAAEELHRLAERNKPFFLAVGFHLPHVPVYASEKWFNLYPSDTLELPQTLDDDRKDLSPYAAQLTLNPTGPRHSWMVASEEWKPAVRAYLAATSFVDSLVGMLLTSLKSSSVSDNTIVVLWSDHGFHLGEKLRWAKRTLWEESTRVPLIIAGPGLRPAACNRPVGLIDVYPTLTELCELPHRPELEGISLVPLLQDPHADWRRPVLTTFGPGNHTLRSEHWRYICYSDGSQELYDHRNDPHEWLNLADDPAYSDIISNLRKWLPKINAPPLPGSRGSDSPVYGEGFQQADRRSLP